MIFTNPLLTIDVLSACAALLGAIALYLLHRCRRLDAALAQQDSVRLAAQQHDAQLAQALVSARADLAQALARQERIKDQERRRIGRDLHDDLGQHLLALTMEVCAIAKLHPRIRQPLAELDGHLRCAIRSLRTVIKDLLPEPLEQGLRPAIEQQLARFGQLSGIACQLDADNAAIAAAQQSPFQTMMYRILQEALNNIARHAQASRVEVGLCRQNNALCLTIRDNGVGLAPCPTATRQRCGLDGMAQRMSAIGGQFHIASTPGQGTALSLSFPLELVLCQQSAGAATAQ